MRTLLPVTANLKDGGVVEAMRKGTVVANWDAIYYYEPMAKIDGLMSMIGASGSRRRPAGGLFQFTPLA